MSDYTWLKEVGPTAGVAIVSIGVLCKLATKFTNAISQLVALAQSMVDGCQAHRDSVDRLRSADVREAAKQ